MHVIPLLLLSVIMQACSPSTLTDFRKEGDRIKNAILNEFMAIKSRDDLIKAGSRIQSLHENLVDVMIAARMHQEENPLENVLEPSPMSERLSTRLLEELNRIYQIEGARDLMEKYQQDSLNRLDKELKKSSAKCNN